MKILKFGGATLSSAAMIKQAAALIQNGSKNIIVLSAFEGTTNTLIEIAGCFYRKNPEGANEIIDRLEKKYLELIPELYSIHEYRSLAEDLLKKYFGVIRSFPNNLFTLLDEKTMLAQGELLSSSFMHLLLKERQVNAALIPALDFMRTDKNSEPDPVYIKEKLHKQLEKYPDANVYITQGYICRNAYGEISNLEREGSDYTATLIGAAVHAEEIQIWTNSDGLQNNDPHYVKHTSSIRRLQFEEAAELAYFGARILHPTCILPAKLNNIPVHLLNTLNPEAPGTVISNEMESGKIKAVAAKDGITAIKIKSGRMLLAYGFLRKVFEIFENYQTSIDMVVTSEVAVSVTIDQTKHLAEILADLNKYGQVSFDRNMTIICIVGDLDLDNLGFESKVVQALKDVRVRMISYGGSNYSISFLIQTEDKQRALQALSDNLFTLL